jgi:cytochrome c oxidase cbb3-type subunit 3
MNRFMRQIVALLVALPLPQACYAAEPDTQGGKMFARACAGCHGLDARGGEHAPNIVSGPRAQNLTEADYLRIIRDGVPGAGMPSFRSRFSNEELQSVVAYLKSMQTKPTARPIAGDPSRGRSLFFGKAQCAKCHMAEGQGGFLGPDLTDYATHHAADVLRLAIVEPNKNLDPRNYVLTVVTRNGTKFSGLARNEDNFSLQLQAEDGTFHLLDKADIAEVTRKPQSIMPDNYGSTLRPEEISALVDYIMSVSAREAVQGSSKAESASHN